jgi:hypothetical protein
MNVNTLIIIQMMMIDLVNIVIKDVLLVLVLMIIVVQLVMKMNSYIMECVITLVQVISTEMLKIGLANLVMQPV